MNNNNLINEPSEATMNSIRDLLRKSSRTRRQLMGTVNNMPFVQKMIIFIVLVSLLIIFIKYISSKKEDVNRFKPYYLDTINNVSEPYNVFNGSVVNSNCINNDCAKESSGSNSIYSNSGDGCCVISKSNFKEDEIGLWTYSFWIYIYSFNNGNNSNVVDMEDNNDWKHVWHRGNDVIESGDNYNSNLIQYPGVWLNPELRAIIFDLNNGQDVSERIEVSIDKYNQWVNYSIVLNRNIVSIYEDGKLSNTVMLSQKFINSAPYNVYLGSQGKENSGFPGYLAYFTYFNKVFGSNEINDLYKFYKKKMDKYIKMDNNYLTSKMLEPILITDKN